MLGVILSVVGDVPVDSEAPVVTSSISRMYRLNLSEMLTSVGLRGYIHIDECTCGRLLYFFLIKEEFVFP